LNTPSTANQSSLLEPAGSEKPQALCILLSRIARTNTLQQTAKHCYTLQHTATHCNTLQHTATHCNTLQHTATHCNRPAIVHCAHQHTAKHCNALQLSATHYNALQRTCCCSSGGCIFVFVQLLERVASGCVAARARPHADCSTKLSLPLSTCAAFEEMPNSVLRRRRARLECV